MKKTKDNKKKKVTNKKTGGKKNLSIVNHGDVVVVKNRSAIAASIIGAIALALSASGLFMLKSAWDKPLFWLVFLALIAGTAFSIAKVIFGKIVLDSPKKLMIIYNPFKIEHKFEQINYVDSKTVKGGDGTVMYAVVIYLGVGKRTVEIASYSKEQADELEILLRGMLDNGSILYPEGNEEPFAYENEQTFSFIKRRKNVEAGNTSKTGAELDLATPSSLEKMDKKDGDNAK